MFTKIYNSQPNNIYSPTGDEATVFDHILEMTPLSELYIWTTGLVKRLFQSSPQKTSKEHWWSFRKKPKKATITEDEWSEITKQFNIDTTTNTAHVENGLLFDGKFSLSQGSIMLTIQHSDGTVDIIQFSYEKISSSLKVFDGSRVVIKAQAQDATMQMGLANAAKIIERADISSKSIPLALLNFESNPSDPAYYSKLEIKTVYYVIRKVLKYFTTHCAPDF